MRKCGGFLLVLSCLIGSLVRAAELDITIHYLEEPIERPARLSSRPRWATDEGLRGAELGIADNATTGRFLGHHYQLDSFQAPDSDAALEVARKLLGQGSQVLLLNVSATTLASIVELPEAADDVLFNIRVEDNTLRDSACRANLLHTALSQAMRADALMQFLSSRRWEKLLLVVGARREDAQWAEALQGSARKFGLDIIDTRQWSGAGDMRRNAAAEVPLLTQARRYDVVVVADAAHDFADVIPYNTWLARPVVGSAGLEPLGWSAVIEQWGALQLQSRFQEVAGRDMNAIDYAGWLAVRSVGEAVTRTAGVDVTSWRRYLLGEQFELAGFKGRPLSFRHWNGQMRQPVPLVHPGAVAAVAPIEGYLHQRNELDTLGLDERESACRVFQAQ